MLFSKNVSKRILLEIHKSRFIYCLYPFLTYIYLHTCLSVWMKLSTIGFILRITALNFSSANLCLEDISRLFSSDVLRSCGLKLQQALSHSKCPKNCFIDGRHLWTALEKIIWFTKFHVAKQFRGTRADWKTQPDNENLLQSQQN
jgi:hypothetical protein